MINPARRDIAASLLPTMLKAVAKTSDAHCASFALEHGISPAREVIAAWMAMNQADVLLQLLARNPRTYDEDHQQS